MKSTRILGAVLVLAIAAGCDDELTKFADTATPPVPAQGVQAFIQVDNDQAGPGQQVRLWIQAQVGSQMEEGLASYTGRVGFDPEALSLARDIQIDDGLRVINSKGATDGEIRFAGAKAGGLEVLTLYEGVFTVRKAGFTSTLKLEMEEMSGANLTSYDDVVDVTQDVFVRRAGH